MEEQAEQGGSMAHPKGGSAEDSTGDTLKNSDWSHAAKTVEDKGVGDVECADQKSRSGDDFPEGGTIRGYCHLE